MESVTQIQYLLWQDNKLFLTPNDFHDFFGPERWPEWCYTISLRTIYLIFKDVKCVKVCMCCVVNTLIAYKSGILLMSLFTTTYPTQDKVDHIGVDVVSFL